jgi:hypothetical protein
MFIDKKHSDERGELGISNNKDCINLNLKIIGISYYDKFQEQLQKADDGVFDTCICGRYLTIIQLCKKSESEMIFIDAKNDYDIALDYYNSLSEVGWPINYKTRFMKMFEDLKPLYNKVYDSIELKLFSEFLNFASSKYS